MTILALSIWHAVALHRGWLRPPRIEPAVPGLLGRPRTRPRVAKNAPRAVGVGPPTGYACVAFINSPNLAVISNTQVITTLSANFGTAIAVQPTNGYVYVLDNTGSTVTILTGTRVITSVTVPTGPTAATINPMNGYVYVACTNTVAPNLANSMRSLSQCRRLNP